MEVYQVKGSNSYSVRAVGTSNYQNALEKLAGGRSTESARTPVKVLLVEENDNPHDENAVKVEIEGKKVGYLSRSNASNYRSLLKGFGVEGVNVAYQGMIVGGWQKEGDYGDFGIRIDFPQII